jgi:mannose-6-phosphate isomerase-like protein (cupin superfamily)
MTQEVKSVNKLEKLELGQTTALRVVIWKVRTFVRDKLGRDVLDVEANDKRRTGKKVREVYRKIDEFMARFFPNLIRTTPKKMAFKSVRDMIEELDYTIVEANETKPWGAFYRMDDEQASRFISEFFPGLTMKEAKLGHSDVKLSPKFLIVAPGQRLSWQFHHRRAEKWRFLTDGAYHNSDTDKQGKKKVVPAGTTVQFAQGERHRLCSTGMDGYVLVAEIWQHTDPGNPSNEDDIVRLADDYSRADEA